MVSKEILIQYSDLQQECKEVREKIEKLDKKIKSLGLNVLISVDGGINNNSATKCRNSGVDVLVIGSALVNSDDRVAFLEKCKQ